MKLPLADNVHPLSPTGGKITLVEIAEATMAHLSDMIPDEKDEMRSVTLKMAHFALGEFLKDY